MLKRVPRRLVAIACSLACTVALATSLWPSAPGRVHAEDTNHDGRSDVWRFYDASGQLTHVSVDSNFDGYPDREERYERGALSHRESDRNFDRHVDLVEEFDPLTHQHERSTVDVDFDGRADLLVLFQDGRPVHSEWAPPAAATPRGLVRDIQPAQDARQLAPFEDPFSASASWRSARAALAADALAVSVSALVVSVLDPFAGMASCGRAASPSGRPVAAAPILAASPRAPPALLLS